jgi:ribosome-binding protein aMBF1 (putative translation factor)
MTNGYDLGLILKNLRIKSGLSQQQLGAKINRDKGIIRRLKQ